MSLIGVQTALGRTVRAGPHADAAQLEGLDLSDDERRQMAHLLATAGFRFTASIQRSWCEARAARGARLALSVLPAAMRREIVGEWVDVGGGTNSFFLAEADIFLDFVAQRLPDPSHALTLCRLEQALLRAEQAAAVHIVPDDAYLDGSAAVIEAGPHAAMVSCFAELDDLLAAIEGKRALPPLSSECPILVAPGLPGLARLAEPGEVALWRSLAEPRPVADLLRQGHSRATIATFLTAEAAQPIPAERYSRLPAVRSPRGAPAGA